MTPLDEIEKDLDWREGELAIIKLLLSNKQINEKEKVVLFRAGWALLYAHYEGFCKFALTVYYDNIQRSGKTHQELPEKICALALDKKLKVIRTLPAIDLISTILNFTTDYMEKPAEFPDIDTESNLWPDTLEKLLEEGEMSISTLQKNNRSLSTLVSRRNKIAHGERDLIIEYSYYVKFHDAVHTLMYDLAITIDKKLKTLGI